MNRQARRALQELLGRPGLSGRTADREAASADAWGRGPRPEVVLWPGTHEEVAGIVALANRFGFPLTARGAGSGKSGGSLALRGGAVIDFSRMNRLIELDPGDMIARVEPGLITAELQAAAAAAGLYYPPDPASADVCTLGGNLAECAGGLRALKYGVTRDYVLGLKAVLGDGRTITTGSRNRRGPLGLDLARLLIGSEGTLGLITEATLKLLPRPEAELTLSAAFPDLYQAVAAAGQVFRAGILPVALEFMPRVVLEAVAVDLPFELRPEIGALLLAQVDGGAKAVREEAGLMARLFQEAGAEVSLGRSEAEADALWAARREVSPSLSRFRPGKVSEDVAVPRSSLPRLMEELAEIGRRRGLIVTGYGHLGDGNVHVNILYDGPLQEAQVREATAEVFQLALRLGGTLSGEHGVGAAKAPFLAWELGRAELELMAGLKKLFDPRGVLNPDKIFPPESGPA